jgi:outer membrane protein OmpA-like peptidoglycan-associated protein
MRPARRLCTDARLRHGAAATTPGAADRGRNGDRTVYFGFNKAGLRGEARNKLDSLAGRLNAATDVTGARIVGYADRIGSVSYNENLSRRRAENVRAYLINHGLVKPSVTETRWVGKSEPSTHCSKYLPRAQLIQCLQPDRKVQVDIEYNTQQYPGDVDYP